MHIQKRRLTTSKQTLLAQALKNIFQNSRQNHYL